MSGNETRDGCKVDRVVRTRGLNGVNEALTERRRGDRDGSTSLRDLTGYFNRTVVERAMKDAGMDPIDGEAENVYRLLTDDDVGAAKRTRVRRRLERNGIDVDALVDDFVSHPTIGTHLKECLGVVRERGSAGSETRARDRIFKMLNRSEAVVEKTLAQLRDGDAVRAGDVSVFVDAQVLCEECGEQYGVATFLERGGCDCGGDGSPADERIEEERHG